MLVHITSSTFLTVRPVVRPFDELVESPRAIAACLLFKTQPHWGMYHQPLASALETQQKDFVAAFTALPAQHTYRFWFNMQQHTQI
ncbi:hypothetical protein AFLA_001186 [Aspergillus flavus NRRL3357]|nr:hypothetical protein AFLA_001186 [Aspergillus flavus NRRL3357]